MKKLTSLLTMLLLAVTSVSLTSCEDEMIADYVAHCQAQGDKRPMQEIATEYNDQVIYPDKVRLNCYYYRHYSFWRDIQMIFATVLGKHIHYAGEII